MKNSESAMTLADKLSYIQYEFKAKKSKYNSFGKYNYRSAEDILEALKPFNALYKVYFKVDEDLVYLGGMPVIISVASIHDCVTDTFIAAKASVGVDLLQKGMQVPQAFGSASSYGKKYALGNLLLIDDSQDSDATNTHDPIKAKLTETDPAFAKAKTFIETGGSIESIKAKYDLSDAALKILMSL